MRKIKPTQSYIIAFNHQYLIINDNGDYTYTQDPFKADRFTYTKAQKHAKHIENLCLINHTHYTQLEIQIVKGGNSNDG